jgi:hypothetical protein
MIENLLLCVGAQKSGTTWLHAQLKDHPEIGFSNVKEVHYFNTVHKGSVLLTRRKVNQLENIIKNNRLGLERYFADLSAGKPVNKGIQKLLSPVDDQWYMDLFASNKKNMPLILPLNMPLFRMQVLTILIMFARTKNYIYHA